MTDKAVSKTGKIIKLAFAVLALGFLIRYLIFYWKQIPPISLRQMAPELAACLLGLVALRLAMAALWSAVLNALGPGLPAVEALRIHTRMMLARYIPGNVWHAVSLSYACGQAGVPTQYVMASWILDNVYTVLGSVLLALLTAPLWLAAGSHASLSLLYLAVPVGLLLAHPRILSALLAPPLRWMRKPPLTVPLSFARGLMFTGLYGLVYLGYGLLFALLASALEGGLGRHAFALAGIYSAAWAIGFLSFLTPSGLGVREAVLAALLARFMPAGSAILAALLMRILMTLSELIAAALPYPGAAAEPAPAEAGAPQEGRQLP